MDYLQISPFVFSCKDCHTPCNGTSKMNYVFEKDASFSERYEQQLIDHINSQTAYQAKKTSIPGYPDIEITDSAANVFYIEVKVQQRTFMQIAEKLPYSGLHPSETIALNLSDLVRYFELEETHKIKIFIFWVLLNRPCIVAAEEEKYYYRLVSELKPIYEKEKNLRRFKRKSGEGDIVDGQHKGVTVNYHFSLNELKLWDKAL